MGLSNSIKKLLLENIERNNYVNLFKPISKQTEFSTIEELHIKTINEIKKVNISSKKKHKTSEITIDKVELSDEEEILDDISDIVSEEIKNTQIKNKDLKDSMLNDLEYINFNKEKMTEPSADISASEINEDYPLLEDPSISEIIQDKLEVESEKEISFEENVEKVEENVSLSDKSKNNKLDIDFFTSLSNIEKADKKVKDTHVQNTLQLGGENVKKIKLTEKYDFF